MKQARVGTSATGATIALSLCLVANLIALMTFPAVLPEISAEWQLTASEAGWIGGICFAGYAVAVLFLVSATDHFDGRWIVAGSSLLGSGASLAFAGLADGFWPALAARFLGGIALAGVHMPVSFCLHNVRRDLSRHAAFPSIPQAMPWAARVVLRCRSC